MSRKAYFNKEAETWDEKYYTPELEVFLGHFVPRFGLKPRDKILDVGTGTGILIPFLLQEIGPLGSITAIDYSKKMVQVCNRKYSHLHNITILLYDIEEFGLSQKIFDAIICFGVFPHLLDKQKALHNMNKALKSGGRLIIAHAFSSSEIKKHHKLNLPVAHDDLPEKTEMITLLEYEGFNLIRLFDEPGLYLCISIKK